MSLVILSSKNQPTPENFNAILGQSLELPPHCQVCVNNVECELNTDIVIDHHNDTFFYGTGNTWENKQNDEATLGVGMYKVNIPHGTYSASKSQETDPSHITYAINDALNYGNYDNFVLPLFRGGWNCNYNADSKIQFSLALADDARASGNTWIDNHLDTLYDVEGTTAEALYTQTADALGYINKVELTATARGAIGQREMYLPLSENPNATGNNRGGLEFLLKIDADVEPEELCGFYGLIGEETRQTFLQQVNPKDVGFLQGQDSDGDPLNIPETLTQEIYPDMAVYIDPNGKIYLVNTVYASYFNMENAYPSSPEANRVCEIEDTGITIAKDAGNDRDLWISFRGEYSGGGYNMNFFYSLETRGDPLNYQALGNISPILQQLTLQNQYPFCISLTTSGNTQPVEVNGDFFDINDMREVGANGTNKDLLMWVGRGNLLEAHNLNIENQLAELNTANLQMLWYVNPVDNTQQFEENYLLTSAGNSTDPDNLTFGNMENNPNYQMALIQVPTLPVKGHLGVAGEGGQSNSCVGVFMLGKDEEQFKYENWIDLHNSNHLTLNNLHILITNIYGQPLSNMWNSSKVVLKFRVNPHHRQQSLLRDSLKQQKLLLDILSEEQDNSVVHGST